MRGHAQDVQVAVADLEHEQDVEPPQRHRAVDVEEVDGQHAGGLGAQELPPAGVGVPRRRRWDPVALEDPPDRRGADAVAEFEQLALDPPVSPARVLPRHPYDQRGEDVVDRWPSGPVRVGPPLAHEVAVPAQDGARGDQAMAPQCSGQPPDQGGEARPGPPSPGVVSGWCGGARRPHAAARGARRPWWRTCGPSAGPVRAPAGRSDTAAAATRRRSCPTVDDRRSPLVSDRGPSSGTPGRVSSPASSARGRVPGRRVGKATTGDHAGRAAEGECGAEAGWLTAIALVTGYVKGSRHRHPTSTCPVKVEEPSNVTGQACSHTGDGRSCNERP